MGFSPAPQLSALPGAGQRTARVLPAPAPREGFSHPSPHSVLQGLGRFSGFPPLQEETGSGQFGTCPRSQRGGLPNGALHSVRAGRSSAGVAELRPPSLCKRARLCCRGLRGKGEGAARLWVCGAGEGPEAGGSLGTSPALEQSHGRITCPPGQTLPRVANDCTPSVVSAVKSFLLHVGLMALFKQSVCRSYNQK